jgi:23S rRNA (pseudouridine1915-N3)-methyltransferase
MRLTIIAVGRLKAGPELSLVETYAARLKSAPARLGPLNILEIDERKDAKRIAEAQRAAVEGLSPATRLIALDEAGELLSTRAFADQLARCRDDSAPEAAFLIGGADGYDPEILKLAHLRLSLGRMTWPHLLVRAMLAEQLYRAASLLAGHPYHRE